MTVRELLARVDSLELAEWMTFYGESPFGDERNDLQAGIIAATIANVNSSKGKAFQPIDFMPYSTEKQDQTQGDMAAILNIMAGNHGDSR